MSSKRSDLSLLASVLVLAIVSLGAYALTKNLSATARSGRVYAAKFVCGIMPNATTTFGIPPVNPSYRFAVSPGRYYTSINIQNTQNIQAKLVKHVLMAPREPEYGSPVAKVEMVLPPRTATSADCTDIYALLNEHPTSTRYMEGFLDVYAESGLDVVGVYTSQKLGLGNLPTDLVATDIEPIPEKPYPAQ